MNPFAPGLLSRLAEKPRKVALLRASRIGDFLCTVPAFRALRVALPEAEITMITLPMLRDLVVRSPYLDRYIAFPGFPGIAEQFFDARRTVQFFQEMQAEQFDLAIQMQGTGVYSNPFMLMLGARVTAGFVRQGDPAGRLDAALPIPEEGHEVRRMLAMMKFLGVPPQSENVGAQFIAPKLEFPLWPQDLAAAESLLMGAKEPLIGIHAAARDATRQWALDRFAAVAAELLRRYGGTVVVLGEMEEWERGEILLEKVNGAAVPLYGRGDPLWRGSLGNFPPWSYLNLAGRTSLLELGAVIAGLSVLVTNDTGPAHIAYALGTPTVTIFGSADPGRYRPLQDGPLRIQVYEVPCRPCGYTECPIGYKCLQGVTVEQVVEAAEEVMR